MSSSESDSEVALSQGGKRWMSLGCDFYICFFEELLVPFGIVAVLLGDLEDWRAKALFIVLIILIHLAVQAFFLQSDPVSRGLRAFKDGLGHADAEELFDQLHRASPSIEHIVVATRRGPKLVGGGHRLYNQVLGKFDIKRDFVFASWHDVSDPVPGFDDYAFAEVTITAAYECADTTTADAAENEKKLAYEECVRRGPTMTSGGYETFSKVTLTPSMDVAPVEGSQIYGVTRPGESIPCWLSSTVYKTGSFLLPGFGTVYRLLFLWHVPQIDYKIVKQVSVLRQAGTDWRAR